MKQEQWRKKRGIKRKENKGYDENKRQWKKWRKDIKEKGNMRYMRPWINEMKNEEK